MNISWDGYQQEKIRKLNNEKNKSLLKKKKKVQDSKMGTRVNSTIQSNE